MKKLLLGSVAFVAVAAAPASAADMSTAPVYMKAPPMAPLYDWTGFYIGAHAGYNWSHSDGQTMDTATGRLFLPSSSNSSGVHVGGQIGYDYMLSSRIVLGVVGTLSSNGGITNTNVNVGFREISESAGKTDYSGNVRARLGYAFDTWLLYGTGGWGWSHASSTRTQLTGVVGNAVPGTVETVSSGTSGWVVGGGLDYAVARNWDVFAEYRYAPRTLTLTFPIAQRSSSINTSNNTIEAGINWRFNWGAPAGARY